MTPSFKLKGSLFTLSVLQLLTHDLKQFEKDLLAKIHLAPHFFHFIPVVLDIQGLENSKVDFKKLKSLLIHHHIIPVGIRGAREEWIKDIQNLDLAILGDTSKNDKARNTGALFALGTKVITEPVRSGQRIYAERGDLIIIHSVSSGAELLADGNIHIYGSLRGRALAGINGNHSARIFCGKLEAELVAVAGYYQLFEAAELVQYKEFTQIYLDKEELKISPLPF